MPWKNGGGETREILAYPAGATLDTLDWRVSLATVASDGPFSLFRGIQRTLCVIDGAGIRLQVGDAAPATLLDSSVPYSFDGEAPCNATLVHGAIVDLNVMTRRERWQQAVRRLTCQGAMQLESSAHVVIAFCQRSQVLCTAGEESGTLAKEDCAVIERFTGPLHLSAAEPAEVLLIELSAIEAA